VVRLLSEIEQILVEGDLTLDEVGRREHMKAIRRGDVSLKDIEDWASDKEKQLEFAYINSTLPNAPRKKEIRKLLVECLDIHYGSMTKPDDNEYKLAIKQIKDLVEKL
jgi:hypothetical protein